MRIFPISAALLIAASYTAAWSAEVRTEHTYQFEPGETRPAVERRGRHVEPEGETLQRGFHGLGRQGRLRELSPREKRGWRAAFRWPQFLQAQ